jgi:hypothetical protein
MSQPFLQQLWASLVAQLAEFALWSQQVAVSQQAASFLQPASFVQHDSALQQTASFVPQFFSCSLANVVRVNEAAISAARTIRFHFMISSACSEQ